MAELTPTSGVDRPFPPGDYPVVVIGSGAGAIQISYSLSRLGIEHAVLSDDPSPGGMFRRWPFFQRLLDVGRRDRLAVDIAGAFGDEHDAGDLKRAI